ncbi:MAG: hypothetical protein U0796_15010 [Gemmatales bacterium]
MMFAMYFLILASLLTFTGQGKGAPNSPVDEIPAISVTDAHKSARYVGFLWRMYNQGIAANPRIDRAKYIDAFNEIAKAYAQLSITWDGVATPVSHKVKDGFPAEEVVQISFAAPCYIELNGKLIRAQTAHNEWSKKIRPGTKVTVKAFIEEIRYTDGGFVIVLSNITLTGKKP